MFFLTGPDFLGSWKLLVYIYIIRIYIYYTYIYIYYTYIYILYVYIYIYIIRIYIYVCVYVDILTPQKIGKENAPKIVVTTETFWTLFPDTKSLVVIRERRQRRQCGKEFLGVTGSEIQW